VALDNNPRRFVLTVTEIDANLSTPKNTSKKKAPADAVVIEFAGHVMPSTKKRLERALAAGNFTLIDKVLT